MSAFTSEPDILGSLSKHFCTYCQDEILPVSCRSYAGYTSKIIFIQCTICEDFYLCLMCFSCGVEIGSHKNYHNFKLVTFSIANVFSLNLLNALEEWVSEDTEKYLGKKKLVLSWKDVAKVSGVKDPNEVEKEYFDTFIDGNLGQSVINLVNKYVGNSQVVTLDRAKEMNCFENCPFYLPPFKYLKVPKNPEKLAEYEVLEESVRSNLHYNKGMIFRNKNVFDTYKLQLLLQCVGEFGYGNWKNISKLYNKTIQMEYPQSKCTYLTATQIMEEYLQHFIVSPILRRTWSKLPNNRSLVPDRTKRIEGPPQLDYYYMLDKKLPFEDLDILFYPSKLDKYENACIVEKVKSNGFKDECLVCTYCQEEFEVISYRTSNGAFSYYELLSVYACCTNKQTCINFYLCLTCLSSGAEIGKHKKNHSYKLISEVKRYSSEAYLPGSIWTALETLALLSASEEWLSDHTDKYINPLNSGNIITDWDSVAQHVRSKNAEEAKIQFEKLVLNERIWKLFKLHFPTDFLMTYEKADEMGCFDNYGSTNIITINLIENNDLNDEQTEVKTKKNWTKFELELLLDYTAIYGYGNWTKISEKLNSTMWLENNKKIDVSTVKTPKEVEEEYIFRFYECPMRRKSWSSIKHVEPIILDRTRFFKQPEDMKYPVVNSNLFAELGYNYATDDFEYPYMDIAESHFNVYCSDISIDGNSLHTNGINKYNECPSENDIKKTENPAPKHEEELHIRKYIDIKDEKALIAFECYNDVLRDRRTAKTIIHNYRLIELFETYKDKELPKMKPLSEQTFEERLIKMSRFMSADVLKELIIGIKQEELLINMLAILKCVYESKRSTKLAETDSDNVSLKRKVAKKPTLVDTVPECQTTTNNCFNYTRPKLSKLPYLKNMSEIPFLSNDICDELLTQTEQTLCKEHNFNSNYFLTRKQDILINGLQEDSSKADCIIHNYLVNFNKI